jgi:hypothetical protein
MRGNNIVWVVFIALRDSFNQSIQKNKKTSLVNCVGGIV